MLLNDKELDSVYGGSLKNILLIGVGSIISFMVGVFGSFFQDC